MSINPYAPPKSKEVATTRPTGPILAVFIGLLIDVGGTFLLSILLGILYAVVQISSGKKLPEILAAMNQTSCLALVGVASGSILSVLGGLVCTRLARRTDYELGYVLAIISATSGLLLSFVTGHHALLRTVLLTLLTVACVLLGTRLGFVRSGPPVRAVPPNHSCSR